MYVCAGREREIDRKYQSKFQYEDIKIVYFIGTINNTNHKEALQQ